MQMALTGYDLINSPRLNKGTAFSGYERDLFALRGLLSPHVGTLDEQVDRRMNALEQESTPFTKYSFMRALRTETGSFSQERLALAQQNAWQESLDTRLLCRESKGCIT